MTFIKSRLGWIVFLLVYTIGYFAIAVRVAWSLSPQYKEYLTLFLFFFMLSLLAMGVLREHLLKRKKD